MKRKRRDGARPAAAGRDAAPSEGAPRAGSDRDAGALAPPPPPPPLWRDAWAWLALGALVPLVLHSLGAQLGEPAAEDFDFLHRALLERRHTLLDGGGSLAFWRPLSQQVYYSLLGPLMLWHPRAIAAIHVLLLGLATLLVYRTLRRAWPGHAAAAAAAFPLLADSTRALITWPGHSADVGLCLFSALAIHEAARCRMPTALAALLAGLLCKEAAVVTALLLPWVPRPERSTRATRLTWAAACGALAALWGVTYLAVRAHAGLELPHGLESNPALLATPVHARLAWALWNSVRAILSLAPERGPHDLAVAGAAAAILAAALATFAASRGARQRLASAAAWPLWGAAWFLAACATLAAVFPLWGPARTLFGSIGLGIAAAGVLSAAHPALLALMLALKLGAFALSPAPPHEISAMAESRGAFTDFVTVARLQMLMKQTRGALEGRFRALPRGAMIGQYNMPRAAQYAYGGSQALQVWYGDSTLRWVRFEEFMARPDLPVAVVVEYHDDWPRQVALVEGEAMRGMFRAYDILQGGDQRSALREIERADSLQRDRDARTFLGILAGLRAWCLEGLGETDAAEREAKRGLSLRPDNPEASMVLALRMADHGEFAQAEARLDSLIAEYPEQPLPRKLLDRVREMRRVREGRK